MRVDLMDRISVIIRNRNESEYIGFAIQSVIDHFKDPEIIIMDNNSNDDSIEIVNLFSLKTNIQIFNTKTITFKFLNKIIWDQVISNFL